ncbi:hypothetical protein EDB85DRAFT_2293116 [Lactarius pseudohatsudake]|nr:hypothetical protein EDB85DRAFT_2293116 [Lactarius pseudohatsudake]
MQPGSGRAPWFTIRVHIRKRSVAQFKPLAKINKLFTTDPHFSTPSRLAPAPPPIRRPPLICTAPRSSQDAAFNPSTFGEPLDTVFCLQERTYLTQRVPIVLPFLVDGVFALGGTKSEGIFRIPGDSDAVAALKMRLDRGSYTLEGVDDPPASLFKLWLRELVDPLVPSEMYSDCIASLQLFLDERVLAAIKMTSANLACDGAEPAAARVRLDGCRVQQFSAFVHNLLLPLNCGEIDAQGDGDGNSEITRVPHTSPAVMRFERHPREFFLNVDGLHRQISYGKLPGLLELTTTHLQWAQDGKKTLAFYTPALVFSTFFFEGRRSSTTNALRATLARYGLPQTGAQTPTSPNNAVPAPAPSRSSNPKCRVRFESSGDPRERRFPHLNTPDLAALHRELVVSGQVTETEFWEGREVCDAPTHDTPYLTRAEPGQLVDPRPQAVEGGGNKIVIAPQLVHDVFDEYPVAAKAYDETCRAKYPSQKLEPRRPRDDEVDMFIDLEATREDHEEAGKRRGALPLIRKFNEHSDRLLESAISTDGTGKRRRLDSGDASDIDLADLHNPEQSSGVLLEMQDCQRYFESRAGAAASAEQAQRPAVDSRAAGNK